MHSVAYSIQQLIATIGVLILILQDLKKISYHRLPHSMHLCYLCAIAANASHPSPLHSTQDSKRYLQQPPSAPSTEEKPQWNASCKVAKCNSMRPTAMSTICTWEVAGVTFLDSNSAPFSKFLNLGPAIFQIWDSDSCSYSGYNHRSNRNLPMFLLRKDHTDSCHCRNWKVTPGPGPVFPKFLTPCPEPGPKEKCRILPESTPALQIRYHLWCT